MRIAVISPWAFIGFENVSHFSEEFTYPVKKIRKIVVASVVFTTLVYVFMTLLSVSEYPAGYSNRLEYISDMGNLSGIESIPAFSYGLFILAVAIMINNFRISKNSEQEWQDLLGAAKDEGYHELID